MAEPAKSILAVSWALPPYLSPRSIQVARSLSELSSLGWRIAVLTKKRSPIADYGDLDYALGKKNQGAYEAIRVMGEAIPFLGEALVALLPGLEPVPDRNKAWAKNAIRQGKKLIDQNKFEAILSFGQPWSSHLVAKTLQEYGQLPWVAHFSDPWSDNSYSKARSASWGERNKALEQAVIQAADAVIFTNPQTSSLVMGKYPPEWKGKVFVIPHGFESNSAKEYGGTPGLSLVYSGSLYGLRSAKTLILALAELKKSNKLAPDTRVTLAGFTKRTSKNKKLIRELGLVEHFTFIPKKGYDESQRISQSADVLLIIDAPSEGESPFLPSKLIEYLQFGKPILGITPKRGASADLLRKIGAPVVDPGNVSEIAAAVEQLQNKKQKGELKVSAYFTREAERYKINNTARELESILTTLIHKRGRV